MLSRNNEFNKIKGLTLNFEKQVLNSLTNEYEFKSLIDDLTLYSDYSLLNTLLIKYQYPNFLSLGTKSSFLRSGVNILDNAKPVKILTPINEEYISINSNDKEIIKNVNELNKTEKNIYYNKQDENIKFHHKDFKGLNIIDLYDVKDTDMNKQDYKTEPLPALFYSSYDDIYNSFVKAIYNDGYKVSYKEMQEKFFFDKDTKTISLKKGLNKQIHLLSLLDVYTTDISSNDMEKELLNMCICRRIGIDKDDVSFNKFNDWYQKQDIKDVDHLLKLMVNKGRKFSNNFKKFYELEMKEQEHLYSYEESSLYDDYEISL